MLLVVPCMLLIVARMLLIVARMLLRMCLKAGTNLRQFRIKLALMSERSSRSHSVFMFSVIQVMPSHRDRSPRWHAVGQRCRTHPPFSVPSPHRIIPSPSLSKLAHTFSASFGGREKGDHLTGVLYQA